LITRTDTGRLCQISTFKGFFIKQFWEQAERQVQAAGDRPVRWYFSRRKRQTSFATYLKAIPFVAALKSFTYQCRRARDE
jgi:hypothetical protein